jgi:predicted small lipoprotein YifL
MTYKVKSIKFVRPLPSLVLALTLAGCGYRGDLMLPEQQPAETPAETPIETPAETGDKGAESTAPDPANPQPKDSQ